MECPSKIWSLLIFYKYEKESIVKLLPSKILSLLIFFYRFLTSYQSLLRQRSGHFWPSEKLSFRRPIFFQNKKNSIMDTGQQFWSTLLVEAGNHFSCLWTVVHRWRLTRTASFVSVHQMALWFCSLLIWQHIGNLLGLHRISIHRLVGGCVTACESTKWRNAVHSRFSIVKAMRICSMMTNRKRRSACSSWSSDRNTTNFFFVFLVYVYL